MSLYSVLTYWTFWIVSVPLVLLELCALVDALTRSGHLYDAYMKKTKLFWVGLLAVGAIIGLLQIPIFRGTGPLGMALAVLPAAVYLADVKPEFGNRR